MDFHERLQAILDSKNLKQVSLAELTGLSSAQVNHLVSGRTKDPKLETVVKIANALDISLDYLAGRREDPAPRLTRDEAVLISDYRDCTPERQRKAADAVRDQRVLSQGQEGSGELFKSAEVDLYRRSAAGERVADAEVQSAIEEDIRRVAAMGDRERVEYEAWKNREMARLAGGEKEEGAA